jgi:hypothetical protein
MRIIHVIPLGDSVRHTADCQCCNAFIGDNGLRVHHSADGREQRERHGENGNPWGLYDEDEVTGLLVFIC